MAKFKFRLKTLLKLRKAERDRRRVALADAYEAERILRQQAEQLEMEITQNQQRMRRSQQPGQVNVDAVTETKRFQLVLISQLRSLTDQTAQVADEVQRRRLALVEADREVRTFQRLRERQQRDHQQQESRLEAKLLDEMAGMSFLRREEPTT